MPVNPNVWAGAQSNQTLAPITPGGGKIGSPSTPVVNKQWWEEGLPAGIGYLVDQGADYLENKEKVEVDPREASIFNEFGQQFMTDKRTDDQGAELPSMQDNYVNSKSNLDLFYLQSGRDEPKPGTKWAKDPSAWQSEKTKLETEFEGHSSAVVKHQERMAEYHQQPSLFDSDTLVGNLLPNIFRGELKPDQRWTDGVEGYSADRGGYSRKWLSKGNRSADVKAWLLKEFAKPGNTQERSDALRWNINTYYNPPK